MENETPALSTERLLIRELQPTDWNGYLEIITNPAVTRYIHIEAWDTDEGRRSWFSSCLTNQTERSGGNYNWSLVLKTTGELVGWIGIGDSDRNERPGDRSMGYMSAQRFWKQGLMTEGLAEILRYEFAVLGVPRVTATCEVSNGASERVMKKVGMQYVRTVSDADPLEGTIAERHHYAIERQDYERQQSG